MKISDKRLPGALQKNPFAEFWMLLKQGLESVPSLLIFMYLMNLFLVFLAVMRIFTKEIVQNDLLDFFQLQPVWLIGYFICVWIFYPESIQSKALKQPGRAEFLLTRAINRVSLARSWTALAAVLLVLPVFALHLASWLKPNMEIKSYGILHAPEEFGIQPPSRCESFGGMTMSESSERHFRLLELYSTRLKGARPYSESSDWFLHFPYGKPWISSWICWKWVGGTFSIIGLCLIPLARIGDKRLYRAHVAICAAFVMSFIFFDRNYEFDLAYFMNSCFVDYVDSPFVWWSGLVFYCGAIQWSAERVFQRIEIL